MNNNLTTSTATTSSANLVAIQSLMNQQTVPVSGNTQTAVKEAYLKLVEIYERVEFHPRQLKDIGAVHLYPSKRVLPVMKKMEEEKLNKEDEDAQLEELFKNKTLSVSKDTVVYYNDAKIQSKIASIKANNIYRKNNTTPLRDGKKYLFVIDTLGRFIIGRKRKKVTGRIQHSSLTQGRPVKTAGLFIVKTDIDQGERSFVFSNFSGHYATKPQHLDYLEQLFVSSNFVKKADETNQEEDFLARYMIFSVKIN